MNVFLVAASSLLTVASGVVCIVKIFHGKAELQVVSWFVWSVLTGIACAASFAAGQVPGGILLLCGTVATSLVVILGFRYREKGFSALDIWCLRGAGGGLLLWWLSGSPIVAIFATVAIDLVGAIPTVKHSWQEPHKEPWLAYVFLGSGGGLTLFVAEGEGAFVYPLYLLLLNAILAWLILASPHRKVEPESIPAD